MGVVVMAMMVMDARGKRWSREDQKQEDTGKNLFHAKTLAWIADGCSELDWRVVACTFGPIIQRKSTRRKL
jgi:hypothetical protein